MAGLTAPLPCPGCGGDMWDNTESKRNPKAPDYACKDKSECGQGIWLKPAEKAALAAQAPVKPASAAPAADQARPQVVLDKVMKACIESALEISLLFKDGDVAGADHDITLRIAQSLFIARTDRKGVLAIEKVALDAKAKKDAEAAKAAQEKAEAERKAQEAAAPKNSFDDFPPASMEEDDDLPF